MTTITVVKDENIQTRFQDIESLYDFLHEYLLAKKLQHIEKDPTSKTMSLEESFDYIDELCASCK
ncbi:MAG: hypothetical protein H6767_02410 [Candidatus Peribacteria bacterium]|nr:MAG: hypothetical protein H6767_02410 [Candidatus Peribacteria bacterium]